MRITRLAAGLIGWVFVAAIAYHVGLGAVRAARAAADGNWGHATELAVIALLGAALVVAAVVRAVTVRSARRAIKRR